MQIVVKVNKIILIVVGFLGVSVAQGETNTADNLQANYCSEISFNAEEFAEEIDEVAMTLTEASRNLYYQQPGNQNWIHRGAHKTHYKSRLGQFRNQFYNAAESFGEDCLTEVATHFLAAALNRTHQLNQRSEAYKNLLQDDVLGKKLLSDIHRQIEKGPRYSWLPVIKIAIVIGAAVVGAVAFGVGSLVLLPVAGSADAMSVILIVAVGTGAYQGGKVGLRKIEFMSEEEVAIPNVAPTSAPVIVLE